MVRDQHQRSNAVLCVDGSGCVCYQERFRAQLLQDTDGEDYLLCTAPLVQVDAVGHHRHWLVLDAAQHEPSWVRRCGRNWKVWDLVVRYD